MLEQIGDIAVALRSGDITAERLLIRCLERIERLDPALNSFVSIDKDGALHAARDSDKRFAEGSARSDLEGIPLSIKDNILVKGVPATWGSRAFEHFVPDRDELPVARLRQAGAVILGKTNVPELTLEGYTDNDLFGVTRNPFDPRLTPGGSSGGAAAGVAAGLVPAAIGTDGGGSIRRPASHTGLVGWKPSIGRIARLWGFPSILSDFEVVGTLTRSVGDACILDAAMKGPDRRDRRSLVASATSLPKPSKLRILYVPRFGRGPVDPEVAAATAAFANQLALCDAEVTEGQVFFDLEQANSIWRVVSRAGVDYMMQYCDGLQAVAGTSVRAMAQDGRSMLASTYAGALEKAVAMRCALAALFHEYDLVLTASAASLPWAAEKPYPEEIDGQAAGPRDHAIFTGWVNIAGLPAVSLPVATSRSGLPIGVQLVAGFGCDDQLLDFAQTQTILSCRPEMAFPPEQLDGVTGYPSE
ncbi:amidase [Rhizobium sp. FY34]|uniref:amidase n=1 Tax=Rhizobium sp. FY34 TaxID=2562309 RepID=UPI0014851ADF|nr:amidase [Rhizobium sp. FY34]